MNRVSRMMHKAYFSSRQRRAIAYSHRYMVTAEDLVRVESKSKPEDLKSLTEAEKAQLFDQLLAGFDPENNDTDRRIHYEVTGVSLIEGEFADEDSSDEEW